MSLSSQSQVVYLQKMSFAHEIARPSVQEESDLLEDLEVNRDFNLLFIAEKLTFSLFIIVFGFLLNQTKRTKILLENLFDFRNSYRFFSKISLILAFFKLSNFFYKQLVNNSIKVMKVLIDSSRIITTPIDLLNSKFEFCFFSEDKMFRLIPSMPEGSTFRRLYEKRQPQDHCVLDLSKLKERVDFTNRGFFVNKLFVRSALSVFGKEKEGAIYW